MIPWAYIVPRPRFRREVRVVWHCPEIRRQLHRAALYQGAFYLTLAFLLPFAAVGMALEWVGDKLRFGYLFPDFEAKRLAVVKEAHTIVPVPEIRQRLGLEPERGTILSKKRDA